MSGVVYSSQGNPLAGAVVSCICHTDSVDTQTDENGGFTVSFHCGSNTADLRVSAEDHAPAVMLGCAVRPRASCQLYSLLYPALPDIPSIADVLHLMVLDRL